MEGIGLKILGALLTTIMAFAVGMTYGGITRKLTARVQNRVGPTIWQNFIDLVKLQSKKTNIYHGVMGHFAPMWIITAAMTVLMFIPVLHPNSTWYSTWFPNLTFHGDLIFLLYMMVFGSLGMALGAGQTGNPNSAIGVTRGLSQMVGFEIPFVLALVALMVQYKTTSIQDIMAIQDQSGVWMMFSNPFSFLAALFASLGMFRYSPFDIVGAPAELASGPVSEFGGKYLGVMMTGGSIFAFIKLTLYVDLFMGGAYSIPELLIKTFALYMVPVFYGWVSPRYRTEQAIRYFWGWPTALGILGVIIAVW
ncbi:MAG: NADH-quinone oxidoreductase subunit H [Bacteroidales bacterium]|nr:NADH-quinone oxidoreductase subunit H [Bacteroidales bacterium]